MTPTPLDQLPFEELARRACEVMFPEDAHPGVVVRFKYRGECQWVTPTLASLDEWQFFGLAVEWIEARGLFPMGKKWFSTRDESRPADETAWSFGVYRYPLGDWVGIDKAPSLPAAALRWIVEHGAKIKDKEAKP